MNLFQEIQSQSVGITINMNVTALVHLYHTLDSTIVCIKPEINEQIEGQIFK